MRTWLIPRAVRFPFWPLLTLPVKSGIALEMNQRARVDMPMEMGQGSDSINVIGTAELLETETTAASSVVSGSTIVNTPLVSRNFVRR